jgi:hypothetical protein
MISTGKHPSGTEPTGSGGCTPRRVSMIIFIALALLLGASASAASLTVFRTDFESGQPTQLSGAGVVASTEGYSEIGFGNQFFRNETSDRITLTLDELPAHSTVSLQFLFAPIDSWDGLELGNNHFASDFLNVTVGDGTTQMLIFQESFNNMWGYADGHEGPETQGYPRDLGNELRNPSAGSLGFSDWPDSAYDLGMDPAFAAIHHTGGVLVVEFFTSGDGWQAGSDESWAIDNLAVSLDAPRR